MRTSLLTIDLVTPRSVATCVSDLPRVNGSPVAKAKAQMRRRGFSAPWSSDRRAMLISCQARRLWSGDSSPSSSAMMSGLFGSAMLYSAGSCVPDNDASLVASLLCYII